MQFYHHLFNIALFAFATGLGFAYLTTRRFNSLTIPVLICTASCYAFVIFLVSTTPSRT